MANNERSIKNPSQQAAMITKNQRRQVRTADRSDDASITESTLRDLPPSAKLVLKVLEIDGPLTQKAIVRETRLPERTVRQALGPLTENGIVEKRPYLQDARQSTYSIVAELP